MEEGRGGKETLADKSLDFENHGPSCVKEDSANLEMVKIFYAVYVTITYFLSALT